jgi:hypothetical protein
MKCRFSCGNGGTDAANFLNTRRNRPMKEFEIIEAHIKKQRHNGRPLHNRRYRLTTKDRDLIKKQLKIFPLEDLLDAITQTHRTPWNLGDNPNGKKASTPRIVYRRRTHPTATRRI